MDKEKEYIAEIQFGSETDTLDPTGTIVKKAQVLKLTKHKLIDTIQEFIGEIEQTPPMYSALKVNGQPLYKLARKGIEIPRNKRKVTIYSIQLIAFTKTAVTIKVVCGRGTYVRTLAKDIAQKLGTVGHLNSLKRTRIGEYDENKCVTIKKFPEWISART